MELQIEKGSVSVSYSVHSQRFLPGGEQALPLELDLALEVLEEDEVLQEDVPPEVAVAELQVHELGGKRRHSVKTTQDHGKYTPHKHN